MKPIKKAHAKTVRFSTWAFGAAKAVGKGPKNALFNLFSIASVLPDYASLPVIDPDKAGKILFL
jgi:hypothetical protein